MKSQHAQYVLDYVQADEALRRARKISRASQRRMLELLKLAIRVDGLLEMVMSVRTGWGPSGFAPVVDAITELNNRFAEYPSVVGVVFDPAFKTEPRFNERVGAVFHPASEGVVARYIFELAEDRLIAKIRPCLCKKLFFAGREDRLTCSALCRHKKLEQKPEFKTKRAAQKREVYRLHKQGRVKESNRKEATGR